MIVLDASVVLELLLGTRRGRVVAERIESPSLPLAAPHLVDLEVAQALRRYVQMGAISSGRGRQALSDLGDLDIDRYPHEPLLARIWSMRDNLTAYDAAYVALAEAMQVPLLTCDTRLAAAPGHHARIDLLD